MTRAKIIDIIKASLSGKVRADSVLEYKEALTAEDFEPDDIPNWRAVNEILPSGPGVFEDVDSTLTQPFSAGTFIDKIFVVTQTGSPAINIGTTNGGGEILPTNSVGGFMPISVQQYFAASGNLYFNISGDGSVNIYIFIDENIL